MKYLLDTCVISELTKKKPDVGVLNWFSEINESDIYLSVITLGEIQKGIALLPDSKKKSILTNWINKDLLVRFSERIIVVSEEIAVVWGEIQGQAEKTGKKIPVIDSLLISTALTNSLTIVTRNIKDLEKSGALCFNPWNK